MTHTNAEIAAFIDANKTRAGWWSSDVICGVCGTDWTECEHDIMHMVRKKKTYTGPDFATDDIACFKELEPPLLAMDAHVHRYNHKDGSCVVWMGEWISDPDPLKDNPYSAAVTAAFSWAMDNQPEALRRACEEVNHD